MDTNTNALSADSSSLESLGFSNENVKLYRDLFIQNDEKYRVYDFSVDFEKQHWSQRKGSITNEMLHDHFIFNKQYSRFAYKWTNHIVLDLDIESDILERYDMLITKFMKPSVLLQSSEAIESDYPLPGGLHSYYFFEKRHQTIKLVQGLKNYLEDKGLKVRSGYLEILPTESISLRLPLHTLRKGSKCPCGSHLLDINDPARISNIDGFPLTFKDSLDIFKNAPRYDFSEFVKMADPKPMIAVPSSFKGEVSRPKCETPVTRGNRNSVWMEWVRDLTWADYNGEDIFNIIVSRMEDSKWNHGSNDWIHNRNKVKHELRSMIRINFNRRGRQWSDKQFEPKSPFMEFVPLGLSEINFIFSQTKDPKLDSYDIRKQQFIFNLLMLLKAKVKSGLTDCPIASNVFSKISTHQSTRDGNMALVEHAISIGVFSVKENYVFKKMPTVYSFSNFPFDISDQRFSDLCSAIHFYFKGNESSIRQLYTRSAQSKIFSYFDSMSKT